MAAVRTRHVSAMRETYLERGTAAASIARAYPGSAGRVLAVRVVTVPGAAH